jgi:hypothetical protein
MPATRSPTAGPAEVRAGEAGTAEAASAGAAATAEARNGAECRTEETMTNTDQGEAPAGTTSGATGISDSPAAGTPWYLHPVVISALVVAAATVLAAIVSLITNWITLSYDTTFEKDKNKTTVLLSILQDYNPNMVPPRNEQMMKDRITGSPSQFNLD